MNINQLSDWINEPETHRKVVGDYKGSYSLGVTDDPPALLLRVQPSETRTFPRKVNLHGEEVPVQVNGGFVTPVPQGGDLEAQ